MKPKVQAQRKFAQGAFVPPTISQTERRTVEPPDQQINIVSNNISAKRVLDSITFAHPGMHLHMPRVVLERCSLKTTAISVTVKKRYHKGNKKMNEKSTRVLRSTLSRQDTEMYNSDDDKPLKYYHLRKKRNNPLINGSEGSEPVASQAKDVATAGPSCSAASKNSKLPQNKRTGPKKKKLANTISEPVASQANDVATAGPSCSAELQNRKLPQKRRTEPVASQAKDVATAGPSCSAASKNRKLPQNKRTGPKKQNLANENITSQANDVATAGPSGSAQASSLEPVASQAKDVATAGPSCSAASKNRKLPQNKRTGPKKQNLANENITSQANDVATAGPSGSAQASSLDNDTEPFVHVYSWAELVASGLAIDFPNSTAQAELSSSEQQQRTPDFEYTIFKEETEPNLNATHDALTEEDTLAGFDDTLSYEDDDIFPDDPSVADSIDHAIKTESNEVHHGIIDVNVEVPQHSASSEKNTGVPSKEPPASTKCRTPPTFTTKCRTPPTFYPTEEEFGDPVHYYIKIATEAAQYGLCKVVAPQNFKPDCKTAGLERVSAGAQYIARLFKRWGEATREMCSIRTYLASHSVFFSRPPLVEGLEVNLPKMFRVVQSLGGFKEVSMKKKWMRVAEAMRIKINNPEKKLDQLYVKYLLPYDILTNEERNSLYSKVEAKWHTKQQLQQKRANNPLHTKKIYLDDSCESSDDGELDEDEANLREAIIDVEDCVKPGRQMPLATYRKVSRTAIQMHFPNGEPSLDDIESAYWEMVVRAIDHVNVYTASVDTSQYDYGFTTNPSDPMSQHPWNLKNIRNNDANILRSLGAHVSMTIPILHFGMVFSTNCWHRDPHGLPWMEYLHEGGEKIWYGIPDEHSDRFRRAVERLCPTSVQNKTIWLPSDITMIPPDLLLDEGVPLTRITQKPGEFVFVFPKAYSCSICTDFTMSESVYFAVQPWHMTLQQVFQELRDSCEPMMFAPEQLLMAIARDDRVSPTLRQQIYPQLVSLLEGELNSRFALIERGIPCIFVGRQGGDRPYNVSEEAECGVCRRPLYLSQVKIKNHKSLAHACPQDANLVLEKITSKAIDMVLEELISDSVLRRILSLSQKKL